MMSKLGLRAYNHSTNTHIPEHFEPPNPNANTIGSVNHHCLPLKQPKTPWKSRLQNNQDMNIETITHESIIYIKNQHQHLTISRALKHGFKEFCKKNKHMELARSYTLMHFVCKHVQMIQDENQTLFNLLFEQLATKKISTPSNALTASSFYFSSFLFQVFFFNDHFLSHKL